MSLHCKLFMMPHMQRKTEKKEIIFSFNHTNLYVVMCATHITIKDPQWYSVQECDATMITRASSARATKKTCNEKLPAPLSPKIISPLRFKK